MSNLYVLEEETSEVLKFDINNNLVFRFGGIEYEEYCLSNPINIKMKTTYRKIKLISI